MKFTIRGLLVLVFLAAVAFALDKRNDPVSSYDGKHDRWEAYLAEYEGTQ